MEYTVIRDFIERKTLRTVKAGEKYACLDVKRADFLLMHGYIAEEVKKDEDKPDKKDKPQKAVTPKRSTKKKA